jgi:hypothetical protein
MWGGGGEVGRSFLEKFSTLYVFEKNYHYSISMERFCFSHVWEGKIYKEKQGPINFYEKGVGLFFF